MRRLPVIVLIALCLLSLVATSCRDEKKLLLAGAIDPERFPTMRTTDVSTLISDSGITRYRITSPLWLVFDESQVPQWKFPSGLHLEKYDDFFRRDATVDCDSAIFFKDKQLWRLDGYVNIANMQGEKFLTPQLFWDQRGHKIYSDSFIHIEKSDRVIEGYGFESNERMTDYRVRNVSGIFPIDQFKGGKESGAPDSSATTTVVTTGSTVRRQPLLDSARTGQRRSAMPVPVTPPSGAAEKASPPSVMPASPAVSPEPLRRRPSVPRHHPNMP